MKSIAVCFKCSIRTAKDEQYHQKPHPKRPTFWWEWYCNYRRHYSRARIASSSIMLILKLKKYKIFFTKSNLIIINNNWSLTIIFCDMRSLLHYFELLLFCHLNNLLLENLLCCASSDIFHWIADIFKKMNQFWEIEF